MNLIEDYLKYVAGTDESSAFVHRWCITTALSAFIGRRIWIPFGTGRINANLYVKIIGSAGSRKSTAIRKMRKLLTEAADYHTFAFEQTSKEKFVSDLANGIFSGANNLTLESLTNSEVFILADEFNDFIGHNNAPFCSLLGQLWDYDGLYKPSFKTTGTLEINNPTITILGGNTQQALQDAFPPSLIGQGFTSRVIFVSATKPARKIAWPEAKAATYESFIPSFNKIRDLFNNPLSFPPQAKSLVEKIYTEYRPIADGRFSHYCSRRHTQLLKLIIVTTASRGRLEVTRDDIIYANTLLTFTESKMPVALGEYGKAKTSSAANRIVELLRDAGKVGLTTQQLWTKGVHLDLASYTELGDVLNSLRQAKKIELNKSAMRWVYVSPDAENLNYVDYSLIPEIFTEELM